MTIEEDEIVRFGSVQTAIYTRDMSSSFFDLQSMLLVEENHMGQSTSTHADNKMLYAEEDRPMVVVDEMGWHAMEVVDGWKTEGIIAMLTTTLDPLT